MPFSKGRRWALGVVSPQGLCAQFLSRPGCWFYGRAINSALRNFYAPAILQPSCAGGVHSGALLLLLPGLHGNFLFRSVICRGPSAHARKFGCIQPACTPRAPASVGFGLFCAHECPCLCIGPVWGSHCNSTCARACVRINP